jgi:hypothetical protein
VDAVDALLFRMKEQGFHVWSSQRIKRDRDGSTRRTANYLRVTIYPLRAALIHFVSQLGHSDLNAQPTPPPRTSNNSGQAAAAKKNQEREARELIVRALQSLEGITYPQWPGFIKEYYCNPRKHTENRQPISPRPFHPPDFDPLHQTPEEWMKMVADVSRQHSEAFLEGCRFWVMRGLDEPVLPAKRTRGRGASVVRSKRGQNTAIVRRHQWAAKYVLRIPLKEIAAQDEADPATVGRIARSILRQANWLQAAKIKEAA